MKRIFGTFFCLLFPVLALAVQDNGGDSLSFAPPPSDFSVVFLGNIFGIVDGVLHGTGSQIMGAMFGVFNSAVLALGGIIIMYTLLVSTMNTAHEGQMLGQKWSSIWVPMRSTLGLALLIPKASGYCLMQIFVMWIAVQGIGAADKVWNAALGYLNRGGTIVQPQVNPLKGVIGASGSVTKGAAVILSGQVCMSGLQQILETQRQGYMQLKGNHVGPCVKPGDDMKGICDNAVPDFISSVNVVQIQQSQSAMQNIMRPAPGGGMTNLSGPARYEASMPNFDSSSPYSALNGICGTLTWNALDAQLGKVGDYTNSLSKQDYSAAKMTRAMAVQQMYDDLAIVAHIMIKNNPILNSSMMSLHSPGQGPFSVVADQQFGIPTQMNGQVCVKSDIACNSWGTVLGNKSQASALFNGTEFQGAISDYNAVMSPTLGYIEQQKKAEQAKNQRQFIRQAEAEGWAMAGSYFFNLSRLSTANQISADLTDTNSGLPGNFNVSIIAQSFGSDTCDPGKSYVTLCTWMQNESLSVNSLVNLMNANSLSGGEIQFTTLVPNAVNTLANKPYNDQQSSTVFGFIRNSLVIQLPGQPGIKAPNFRSNFNLNMADSTFMFPPKQFGCKGFLCLASIFADVFYNVLFVGIWNIIMNVVSGLINQIVFAFILGPLEGMAEIFLNGVSYLQQSNANPIVSLAVMGINYINFSGNMWMYLIELSVFAAAIPVLGFILFAMLAMVMPLLLAWLSVMVTIGFTTAYYVPIMPYMIFSFGVIAWLISVIEAMVAAPIVAVGVTHPEGHEAFGKGEHAVMILMNVFLRPAMMIIGYISAIALSYVAVWVVNSGFQNAVQFIQGSSDWGSASSIANSVLNPIGSTFQGGNAGKRIASALNSSTGYSGWAGVYGFFFVILMYTTMYLTVVQKSFTLVTYLPDKILRWIGGQPEGIGQETAQWGEESKGKIEKGGEATTRGKGKMDEKLSAKANELISKPKEAGGVEVK